MQTQAAFCTQGWMGFTRANAHFRQTFSASDSCGCGLFRAGSAAISRALPPSSGCSRATRRIRARGCSSSPAAGWASRSYTRTMQRPGFHLGFHALHRREPEFHHNSFSAISILSLASLWPESGTHVTHPRYLFARILSQQAFPIPESGAKIIRFNVLSKWFSSIKQTDTRGILTALCLSLWGLWPPVFPHNWEVQIAFKVWDVFIKKREALTYSCDSGN